MATLKEVDHITACRSDQEEAAAAAAVGEQTPERRCVNALLDISEEDFMKELEPYEYHCYPGWEEAVHGWARVAPMSCILLPQKRYRKPKHKEADNPTPLSVDPTIPDADSSGSSADDRCESRVVSHNSFKATTSMAGTPLQPHHHLPLKYSDNRPTKPHKYSPNNIVVPIKTFTFLPPIKSPRLRVSGQLCSGKKAPEGGSIEENCFMLDKKSGTRGTRVDRIASPELHTSSAAQTSEYRTCQHNPHLFSAVSIPRRYQVKPDTVHRTSYSMGKSLYPSNTVCM
ncbi:uncharacterized protein C16orf46 homolog [Sebastes fasciatus]|uniref:uncharacterized protein C16orf46 homolog n=1 Tax=Sebastes fasciatus TaxID=394691 RepID=UPI003D9E1B4A